MRELRVLRRVLSRKSGGVQLEADSRHQETLISELEQDVRGLGTPDVKNQQRKAGDGDENLLDEAEAHSVRSTAARANYLALDRTDLAFATKELCRRTSSPTKADLSALRQVSRHLLSAPRLVCDFPWQPEANLDVFVHSAEHFGRCSNEGRVSFRSLELDVEGCDAELCSSQTVWNREGRHGSAWDPECWRRPWLEHDREYSYRLSSSRRNL